jgi:hypothetical protein
MSDEPRTVYIEIERRTLDGVMPGIEWSALLNTIRQLIESVSGDIDHEVLDLGAQHHGFIALIHPEEIEPFRQNFHVVMHGFNMPSGLYFTDEHVVVPGRQ